MFHYNQSIQNTRGDALIGYFVQAISTADGSVVPIYADSSSTPIISVSGVANMALVNSDGMADFWIAGGEYHVDIYASDATTLIKRKSKIPMIDTTADAATAAAAQTAASTSETNAAVSAAAAAASASTVGTALRADATTGTFTTMAGVLRQTTAGGGWAFIADTNHAPAFVSPTVSVVGGDIQVAYGFTAAKVVTFVCQPDETYAGGGLVCGASVSTDLTLISLYVPFEIRTNGTTYAVGNYLEKDVDITATFTAASGTCVVTHPPILHTDTQGGFVSIANIGPLAANQHCTIANDPSKTGFTINFNNAIAARVQNASLTVATALVSGTVTAAWDGTSTLTVTHPASGTSLFDATATTNGTYVACITASTSTTTTIQYRDYAGALYSGASHPTMDTRIMRGGYAKAVISGATKLHIRRGLVQARAEYVSSATGNIWIMAVMQR